MSTSWPAVSLTRSPTDTFILDVSGVLQRGQKQCRSCEQQAETRKNCKMWESLGVQLRMSIKQMDLHKPAAAYRESNLKISWYLIDCVCDVTIQLHPVMG